MKIPKEIFKIRKCQKGDWAFLEYRKIQYLLKTIVFVLIGLAIFFFGLIINKYSHQNIFTILAILMVLPGARSMVGFITFVPYHGVEKERYEKVKAMMGEGDCLFTGIVVTSPDKIMNLDFLVQRGDHVIGLVGRSKQKWVYIQNYLTKGVANWYSGGRVQIFTEEKKFMKTLQSLRSGTIEEENKKKIYDYLYSLIVG